MKSTPKETESQQDKQKKNEKKNKRLHKGTDKILGRNSIKSVKNNYPTMGSLVKSQFNRGNLTKVETYTNRLWSYGVDYSKTQHP